MGRHGEADLLGPPTRHLAGGADEPFEQARAEDRGAFAVADVADQRIPGVEARIAVVGGGEAGDVLDPAAADLGRRRPAPRNRGTIRDHRSSRRRAAVDLAVQRELLEKRGHEAGERGEADPILHRQDRRDAGLGQPGADGCRRPLVAGQDVVTSAGGLARAEDHLWRGRRRQVRQAGHQFAPGRPRRPAVAGGPLPSAPSRYSRGSPRIIAPWQTR